MPSGKFTKYRAGDRIGDLLFTHVYTIDSVARAVCTCERCGNDSYDNVIHEIKRRQQHLAKKHGNEPVTCGCQTSRLRSASTRVDDAKSYKRSYHVWRMMLKRCNDETYPAYRNYGARGM